MEKSIKQWQSDVHQLAISKGWWDQKRSIPELLMLIVSEAAEALEEYRLGQMQTVLEFVPDGGSEPMKPVGFPSECADIAIRLWDLCEHEGIDLEEECRLKHDYNTTRSKRHGGKVC